MSLMRIAVEAQEEREQGHVPHHVHWFLLMLVLWLLLLTKSVATISASSRIAGC